MSSRRTATPRRAVGLCVALAVAVIVGMVGLGDALRFEHPLGGPVTPELPQDVDPLREEVSCEIPAPREGEEAVETVSESAPVETVTSNELYDCPRTWDGRRVRYVGEAIGAVLERGDHAWVQLNDDIYAGGSGSLPTHRDFRGGNAGVGARLSIDQAAQITTVGGPTTHGDFVEVVATFSRVHDESAEVAVLEVESLTLLREGSTYSTPEVPARRVVALIAAMSALAIVVIERRRRSP